MSKSQAHLRMGTAPMTTLIITMSLPTIFSMMIIALYNIVDSIFVSQLGEEALTAVSLAFPIQLLTISISSGTGIGTGSLISRLLGAKKYHGAVTTSNHGLLLSLVNWIGFVLFGIFGTAAFINGQTDNPQVAAMAIGYTSVVSIFSFGVLFSICMEKIFQATGNTVLTMYLQAVGAIINIVLDPLFIFGLFGFPKLGVVGAGVATVIGQISSMLLAIYFFKVKPLPAKPNLKEFKLDTKVIGQIYKVGLPSMVMQSLASVTVVVLNSILINFSQASVAVMGVYFKLQSFVTMPIMGLSQGLMPIMAYNYGAGNKNRLLSALKNSIIMATTIMILGFALFQFGGQWMLSMFNASDDMYAIGINALQLLSYSFLPIGFSIMVSTMFQSVGKGVYSLIASGTRQMFVLLPFAYFASQYIGINGVWLAFPVAELVAIVIVIAMFVNIYNKEIKHLTFVETPSNLD